MKILMNYIDSKTAAAIKNENEEYLVWADGSEITADEISWHFRITGYPDQSHNLEHKDADFRIEDIII